MLISVVKGVKEMTELLTTNQAAEELQIHVVTLYRMIKAGKLPAKRLGARLRIEKSDLQKLLDPNTDRTHASRRRKTNAEPRK